MRDVLVEIKKIVMNVSKDIRVVMLVLLLYYPLQYLWKIYVCILIFNIIANILNKENSTVVDDFNIKNLIILQAKVIVYFQKNTRISQKIKIIKKSIPRLVFVIVFRININFTKIFSDYIILLVQYWDSELRNKHILTKIRNIRKINKKALRKLTKNEIYRIKDKMDGIYFIEIKK